MRIAAGLLASTSLILTACEGGGDPVQMALRDAAAARQAAALKETVPPAAAPREQETVPEGDAAYVAGMIQHHRAALARAEDALARSGDPEIRRLAEAEIEARSRDIAALQAWTPAG